MSHIEPPEDPPLTGATVLRTPLPGEEDRIGSNLRRVYDDALNETIPQSMLDLLSALDDASDRKDGN